MQDNNTQSQADRLANVLQSLKEDVTADDKKAATKKLEVSAATVSAYLNGQVLNNDAAVSLIKFFKKRIAERDKAIA